jgi:hypothetical protein
MGGPQINMHDFGGMNEMFSNMFRFGPGFAGFHQQGHIQKNRDLNLRCQITLRDSFVGKELEATYTLPSGKRQTVGINVPIGIENGQTIRYNGLGDDTYPQLQRGHLNVTVLVEPVINYHRRGDDICTVVNIDAFEAMSKNNELKGEQKILAIQKEMEETTALEVPMLQQNMSILSTLASVATLLGLVGTVLGMIRSFAALATAGAPDQAALANGISEALINTFFGIFGSTIAIIAYNFFSTKIDAMTYSIDEAAFTIVQDFSSTQK